LTRTRIFLECSGTWESDVNTGIQRVVRNIVKEATGLAEDLDVEVVPVMVKFNRFWSLGAEKKPVAAVFKAGCLYLFKKIYYKVRPFFVKILPVGKIEHFLVFYSGRFISSIFSIFFPLVFVFGSQSQVAPGKGDIIFLLDSSWVYSIWRAVKQARNNGAVIGLLMYDIIPITHRDLFPSAITWRFNAWLKQAVEYVDFFISISEATQNQMLEYLRQNHPGYLRKGRFDFFYLGCTLDNISINSLVRSRLKTVFQKSNIYIAVGTIEPRKNHQYLLDVFDLVWSQSPDFTLCIIGKIGWLSEEVIRRIKQHTLFNRKLFMFHNVSDNELGYCYQRSKALIFSSLAEGFGLPIVEALGYGLPVLASDIPVHREVGKDFCTYFDISNPASLAKILMDIEKTKEMPKARNNNAYKLLSWKDSCRDLLTKIQVLSLPT
jgi:O-antigen biosynthesis alpha-1,2-rhamnosyltransferase